MLPSTTSTIIWPAKQRRSPPRISSDTQSSVSWRATGQHCVDGNSDVGEQSITAKLSVVANASGAATVVLVSAVTALSAAAEIDAVAVSGATEVSSCFSSVEDDSFAIVPIRVPGYHMDENMKLNLLHCQHATDGHAQNTRNVSTHWVQQFPHLPDPCKVCACM